MTVFNLSKKANKVHVNPCPLTHHFMFHLPYTRCDVKCKIKKKTSADPQSELLYTPGNTIWPPPCKWTHT